MIVSFSLPDVPLPFIVNVKPFVVIIVPKIGPGGNWAAIRILVNSAECNISLLVLLSQVSVHKMGLWNICT